MSTVTTCPKCGSDGLDVGDAGAPFGCGDCDWEATNDELMEY